MSIIDFTQRKFPEMAENSEIEKKVNRFFGTNIISRKSSMDMWSKDGI